MSKKVVIAFEGIEGSGKTFHINYVSDYLKKKKISYIKLREPGGSKNSEKIRKLILNNKSNFIKDTDLLLFLAARSENIEYLKKFYKKKIILLDRFTDSTIAYQHYGMGINSTILKKINNYLLKNFKVDFTFLNIVNINNMKKRLHQRKKLNRYDEFKDNFYKKVQNGFLRIAKRNRRTYQIINSNLSIKLNREIIINKIDKLIK
jgi:dTMP kinase